MSKIYIFLIILLTGCSYNIGKTVDPKSFLINKSDLNESFEVVKIEKIDDKLMSESDRVIDIAIKELEECSMGKVKFYSDYKAEYEGETLIGEMIGGNDMVYAEINSYVYVMRGIEKERSLFLKYKDCYGDYIKKRFIASLPNNVKISKLLVSSESIKGVDIIRYSFDISNGNEIYPVVNSIFIANSYSLISVVELINIGGDVREDEKVKLVNSIIN
jgi:hypothetical protein